MDDEYALKKHVYRSHAIKVKSDMHNFCDNAILSFTFVDDLLHIPCINSPNIDPATNKHLLKDNTSQSQSPQNKRVKKKNPVNKKVTTFSIQLAKCISINWKNLNLILILAVPLIILPKNPYKSIQRKSYRALQMF